MSSTSRRCRPRPRSSRCRTRARSAPATPIWASSATAPGPALTPLLPFAQLDYAGSIALADGRYLVRPDGEPEADPDVLVVRRLGTVRAGGRLRKGKPVPLEAEPPPDPLPITRLTLIKALPFATGEAADDWLEKVSGDDEISGGLLGEVATTINRALLAYRVSAPDAYAADMAPSDAIAVRFGYGSGQEVSEGRWSAARELAEDRRRSLRNEVIDGVGAQERIAAVLGGRDRVRPEEELLLEAERAAEQGRTELAAIMLGTAIDCLVRSGGTPEGEIAELAPRLRKRAQSGADIDGAELSKALRAGRRAIRARLSGPAGP